MTATNDCSAFQKSSLFHREAIALLQALAVPRSAEEALSVFAAAGRVCAEQIRAPRPIPAHANSAVDGYAFAFDDYDAKHGSVFPVAGRAAAGRPQGGVERGAVRIFTGATMPRECDTVAMQEDCRAEDASVFVPGRLNRGANRRLAGEDMQEGATILEPGHRLRPQDAAALAACGRREVICFRKPRIAVFSTGDEILPLGAPFEEGKVYDANGPMLSGLLSALAADVSFKGILPDSRDAVREALESAALHHDVIVTSGGASLGDEDHVIASLRERHSLSLWRLAIKPGRVMGVGKIGSSLCFALPGNPVAAMSCALLYVCPAVRRLGGEPWIEPQRFVFPAGFEIRTRKLGRREFLRGWLEEGHNGLVVKKYERDGSGLISSLRAATGLIEILEDQPGVHPGEAVNFLPFSAFGLL